MRAFILAGGFATRLWPLTERRAKPLLPLAGRAMLDHIVERIPAEIPVTISTNAAFADGFNEWKSKTDRANIEVIVEETKSDDEKLGALGAVAQWIEQQSIDDDLLLLTGDNYFGFRMEDFLAASHPGVPLVAGYDIADIGKTSAFGTIVLQGNGPAIDRFEEKPKEPKSTLVSTGCSLLPSSALRTLVEHAKTHPDNVGGLFEELLRRGQGVECFVFREPWFDVGSFEAYLEANRTLVGDQLLAAPGSTMEGSTRIGSVVLGKNCTVRNSTLENVVLFDHCTIEDCVLHDCVIDDHCNLRRVDLAGKMLRTGTVLTAA